MGMEILILKKVAGYASLKMLMGISGKDHVGIYRSIMFYKTKEIEGFNFLRKGRVTYVTEQEVNWIFLSCEHNKFLGFWFCFEWPSTFCVLTAKIISSLFFNSCNDCFKETYEIW